MMSLIISMTSLNKLTRNLTYFGDKAMHPRFDY